MSTPTERVVSIRVDIPAHLVVRHGAADVLFRSEFASNGDVRLDEGVTRCIGSWRYVEVTS